MKTGTSSIPQRPGRDRPGQLCGQEQCGQAHPGQDCKNDLANLLRAYNLLVATRDDERIIAGQVSRAWLHSEREDFIKLSESGVVCCTRFADVKFFAM